MFIGSNPQVPVKNIQISHKNWFTNPTAHAPFLLFPARSIEYIVIADSKYGKYCIIICFIVVMLLRG